MKKIMLELLCELTPEELLLRGQALSVAAEDYATVESDKKTAMSGFKEQLDDLRMSIARLSSVIRAKAEGRLTECAVEFHSPAQATKRITRLDTGEFVRDEPMTALECQSHLFDAPQEETRNDELYGDAIRLVFEFGKGSTSLLQRRLRIGYGRATHLLEMMQKDGLVGPADGVKPREVLKTKTVEELAERVKAAGVEDIVLSVLDGLEPEPEELQFRPDPENT